MKPRLYISAIYISQPGTMGGNTKILLEAIKHLSNEYHIVVITTEPATFATNLAKDIILEIEVPTYPFRKMSPRTHFREVHHLNRWFSQYFTHHGLNRNDIFYSASDFAPDVIPIYQLRRKYTFKWIASLYLFIPSPWQNLKNKYGFPFLKYSVYHIYQKALSVAMNRKASGIMVTNQADYSHFRNRPSRTLFAIYGGVNLEEIREAEQQLQVPPVEPKYDVLFCGRLHEQKGIDGLLDIWRIVVNMVPNARLGIIGNGDPRYESYLKRKATNSGLDAHLDWLGYINGIEKYKIYLQSKVFAHSTIYDNNGMVAAEALCAGLPVLMYDLPNLRQVYEFGCAKIPMYDRTKFADAITSLITDPQTLAELRPSSEQLETLRSEWSWENRMLQLSRFLNS